VRKFFYLPCCIDISGGTLLILPLPSLYLPPDKYPYYAAVYIFFLDT
jgi:hypothetical protein